jgi:RNA polymerase sigma factor (sigma-70 family)
MGSSISDHTALADADRTVEAYRALAYGIAKRYVGRGLPLDDLRQEALLGLLDALHRFQPDKGAAFSTYAFWWVRSRIIAALDEEKSTSLQAGEFNDGMAAELSAPEDSAYYSDTITMPFQIPELERRILASCFAEGLTLKETAQALGISVERVKQLRGKALRRIRACKGIFPDQN